MWRFKLLFFAPILAALLVSVGCGSSSSETTPELSKAELLARGDQICTTRLEEKNASVEAALAKVAERNEAEPSTAAMEATVKSVVTPFRKLTRELSNLSASEDDKAALEKITTELEAGLKKIETSPSSALVENPFGKAAGAAKAFGFKACGF